MGHHQIPQRYLKGFESPDKPGCIWTFNKQTKEARLIPIKNVAQARGYFDPDVEASLNTEVEIPGGNVIDKIIAGDRISVTELVNLTRYVATTIRRVPHARKAAKSMVPQALNEVMERTKNGFREAAAAGMIDADTLAARLAEAHEVGARFQAEPPKEVREQCESPWPFFSWVLAIQNMYRRVLRVKGAARFLTSDRPAHTFEEFGLGHPECELILPLNGEVLLHYSYRECWEMQECVADDRIVKEMNRRVASGATRFVFYHCNAPWVHSVAMSQPEQLHRVHWPLPLRSWR